MSIVNNIKFIATFCKIPKYVCGMLSLEIDIINSIDKPNKKQTIAIVVVNLVSLLFLFILFIPRVL